MLELGTFTGYSALCLSEGLSQGGSWYDGASVVTVESDAVAASVARAAFDRRAQELHRPREVVYGLSCCAYTLCVVAFLCNVCVCNVN